MIKPHSRILIVPTWWTNNRHSFWAFRWVWAGDPYAALEEWQEYKHMTNPSDDRSLTQQIIDDYSVEIEEALKNPFVRMMCWARLCWDLLKGFGDRSSRPF